MPHSHAPPSCPHLRLFTEVIAVIPFKRSGGTYLTGCRPLYNRFVYYMLSDSGTGTRRKVGGAACLRRRQLARRKVRGGACMRRQLAHSVRASTLMNQLGALSSCDSSSGACAQTGLEGEWMGIPGRRTHRQMDEAVCLQRHC